VTPGLQFDRVEEPPTHEQGLRTAVRKLAEASRRHSIAVDQLSAASSPPVLPQPQLSVVEGAKTGKALHRARASPAAI
jgi:hypothetical protein